jgi:hypothetical protein
VDVPAVEAVVVAAVGGVAPPVGGTVEDDAGMGFAPVDPETAIPAQPGRIGDIRGSCPGVVPGKWWPGPKAIAVEGDSAA